MEQKAQSQSATDFVLEEAVITSSDGEEFVITDVITDIDVYEHLDKPYITGVATFLDPESALERINFYGVEKFFIRLKLPENSAVSIEKTFLISKVVKSIRTNDSQNVITIHLLEDIAYLSEMQNVNKSYFGKGYEIISKIVKEFLGKELSKPRDAGPEHELSQDAQGQFGVVIPDMRPLKAADWIKDRITTSDASPFYFFSTLTNDKLHLLSLSKMLSGEPVNSRTSPYIYSQAFAHATNPSIDRDSYNIEKFSNPSNDELLKINSNGFLNSQFAFHDVTRNKVIYPGHRQSGNNKDKNRWTAYDMFETRAQIGRALGEKPIKLQDAYPINAALKEKGGDAQEIQIHQRNSSHLVSNIYSSDLYDANIYSIGESRSVGEFVERLDSKGLRHWVVNYSLNFSVPGRNFISGLANLTIGNKYKLLFLAPSTQGQNATQEDTKKSGEYLIYAARHSFTREGYMAHMTGVKLIDTIHTQDNYAYNIDASGPY
jgi:hypothetical protein